MQLKPIRDANKLSSSQVIGYGCIYAMRDFRPRGSPNYNHEEMDLFQIIERTNDKAYKVDLYGEYGVSVIFNVSDLTLFDVGNDSGSNPFKEIGDDEDQPNTNINHAIGPLEVLSGPITRARVKKLKEALNELV
jgi:hypothetical protein